jgi:subtilase family serine protease
MAAEVSTPGSPLYRHYLPAGAFAPTFGPTSEAIAAVEAWLTGAGLRVDGVSADHLAVSVAGSAQRLSEAFSTSFERYRVGARTAYSNTEAQTSSSRSEVPAWGIIFLSIGLHK